MPNKKEFDLIKYLTYGLFGAFLTVLLTYTDVGRYLRTSIVDLPEHAPFDGTVYPVQKVPDWLDLSTAEWDYDYSEISTSKLLDTPFYDPAQLAIPTEDLTWGDSDDDEARIAKITYSVPYMGNYKLDGKENAGSHPAVDIKLPYGTPIFSVANGTVSKVSEQSTGFGYHVVVQTNNAPSPSNDNELTTLHFSYSHLSAILVEEGDVVTKGEQIALSGDSGTSTTPHLHFQLDNENAPWHPFWPFTSSEAYEAGYGFFEAINAGLGKEKALEATDNPLKYVQAYMDGNTDYVIIEDDYEKVEDHVEPSVNEASSYIAEDSESEPEAVEDLIDEIEAEVSEEEIVEDEPEEESYIPELAGIEVEVASKYYLDSIDSATFQVRLVDQKGQTFTDGFAGEMTVFALNGEVRPSKSIVTSRDFKKGILINSFAKAEFGQDRIEVEYEGEQYRSKWFELIDEGGKTFSDVPSSHPSYQAISYLADEGVVAGYPDGTFRPDQVVTRVEAIKLILEGIGADASVCDLPFSDTPRSEWYAQYLCAAYKGKIVNGYPDGSFKPGAVVNKAEFYKILFNSMGVDVPTSVKDSPFTDVPADAWFAPFIYEAKELGVVENAKYFYPENGMKRSEVADAIFRVMTIVD